MNPISVGVSAPVIKPNGPANGAGRSLFKALLLASALLGGSLAARPADASLIISTTGTISTGSETGNLFGLGSSASLAGDSYTLTVEYDYLGPGYSSIPGVSSGDDEFFPGITGYVIATINGHSVTTSLTSPLVTILSEDLYDLYGSNEGNDGSGDFISVSQGLNCNFSNPPCVPNPDLNTAFTHLLVSGDVGTDLYTYDGASFPAPGTPTATFTGTETSLSLGIPEPASWLVLASGFLGMALLVRRRSA